MSLLFINCEIFLSIALLNLIVAPLFLTSKRYYSGDFVLNLFEICKQYMLFVMFFSFVILVQYCDISYNFYGYGFFINDITNFLKILIVSCLFFMLLSVDTSKIEKMKMVFPYGLFEVFPLLLFNVFGILCFLSAENFLTLYISLELQSLALALLFAVKYFSKYSSEAALKYYIVSSFSTSVLLLAFGFLYGIFGVIHLESVLYLISFDGSNNYASGFFEADSLVYYAVLISLILVLIAFSIKLGTAPFHMWTLDVYEGAPLFVTLYALVLPKITYVGFLIKLVFYFSSFGFVFFNFFFYSGLLSIIVGTLGAVMQTKIKRLLAYSAISNFGYVMFGLSTGSFDGFLAAIIFLITYILITCSIFFILFSLVSAKDGSKIKSIFQLQTITASGKPLISFFLSLHFFAIASIPPFNIFIAKYYLLYSLIENFSSIAFFSVIFILLFSVISCFYYMRIVRLLFFRNLNSSQPVVLYKKPSFGINFMISLTTFLNLFLFFYPEILFDILEFFFLTHF